ncbi:MAG: ABC transporter ATP-binding protein, partial [Salinirussus sp.]
LDLALALQHQPDMVLLDEPFGALDDVTRRAVLEFLEAYAKNQKGVVVSTHRVAAVAPALDRMTVLREGKVLLDKPRDALTDDADELSARYVATVLEAS